MRLVVPFAAFALGFSSTSCIFVGDFGPVYSDTNADQLHDLELGNGVVRQDVRALDPFDTIWLDGPVNAEIEIGDVQSVTVACDENLIERLQTTVGSGALIVRWTRQGVDNYPAPVLGQRVRVTVPKLERLVVAGAGDARLGGLKGGALTIAVSGSGCVRASGSLDELSLSVSGSGDAQLSDLAANRAVVSISGSGDANVDVRERLDAVVSGSGVVRYRGAPPVVKRNVSGSGGVMDVTPVSVGDR